MALAIGMIADGGRATRAQSIEDLGKLSIEQLANIEVTSVTKSPEPLSRAAAAVYVITAERHYSLGCHEPSGSVTAGSEPRSGTTECVQLGDNGARLQLARGRQQAARLDRRAQRLFASGRHGRLGGVRCAARQYRADRGDQRPRRYALRRQRGQRRYQHYHQAIERHQGGLQDAGGGNQDRQDTLRYGGRIGDNTTYRGYGYGFDRASTPPYHNAQIPTDAFYGGQSGFRLDGNPGPNNYTVEGDLYDHVVVSNGGQFWGGNLNAWWSRRLDNGSTVKLQAYYSSDTQNVPNFPPPPNVLERLDTYDVQGQQNLTVGVHQLVWGAEARLWQVGVFSSGPFFFAQPEKPLWLGNAFAQDEISLRRDLVLTLGVKGEYYTYTGFAPLPNIRLGWQATPDIFFWSAVSRAIRTPSRIDRELESPGLLAPSPDFQSEKLTAFEIGYRGQPTQRISLSVSSFYNIYNDLRTDALTNGGLPIVLMNGLAGNTYGIEAWATYSITDWWRLKPGANWMHKNLTLNPGATDFSQRQAAGQDPPYQVQLRSEMNLFPTIELDTALRGVGRVSPSNMPAYVEADARLAWHATPTATFEIDGFNLLHAYHLEVYDPSTSPPRYIPRSVFFRMRASF